MSQSLSWISSSIVVHNGFWSWVSEMKNVSMMFDRSSSAKLTLLPSHSRQIWVNGIHNQLNWWLLAELVALKCQKNYLRFMLTRKFNLMRKKASRDPTSTQGWLVNNETGLRFLLNKKLCFCVVLLLHLIELLCMRVCVRVSFGYESGFICWKKEIVSTNVVNSRR